MNFYSTVKPYAKGMVGVIYAVKRNPYAWLFRKAMTGDAVD